MPGGVGLKLPYQVFQVSDSEKFRLNRINSVHRTNYEYAKRLKVLLVVIYMGRFNDLQTTL